MKIKRFEDIEAWKKGKELVTTIYGLTGNGNFAKDYGLRDQIRRGCVSVMSNIAEGYARQTDKEFVQFLYIAPGSVAEVQSQLYIAQDLNYLSGEQFDEVHKLSGEVARLVTGFAKYLQGRNDL
jgi:four helix bundle protein